MNVAKAIDAIPVVQSTTERAALFAIPATDQRVFNKATGNVERYNGSAWVTDFALRSFDVKSSPYNAVGDGVVDDTASIVAAATALQANGGGYFKFPAGSYKVTAVPAAAPPYATALFTFTNLTGVVIDLREALINDVAVYAGTQEAGLFDFVNCRDVDIRGRVQSQAAVTTSAGTTHAIGLVVARFKQGCKNIFVDLDITGCKAGVEPTKAFNDPESYRSSQFRGRIVANGCYYPWIAQFSGDDAELAIDTDTCGRSFYIYGVNNQRLNIRAKNQQVTSVIWAFNGFGCRDLRIDFCDQTSNSNQAAAPRIQFGWGDLTPATHANIDLRLDILNPAASPFGNTLEFIKYSDGGTTPDAVGRGHVLDGFRLSGNSNQQAGISHVTMGAGAFAAPDVCRNFAVRDFTGLGATSPIQFSAATPIGQLQGRAVFENSSSQHNIVFSNGANGECVFLACQALNFSALTTDTDKHMLIDCTATDGTQQSIINKTFLNTLVGSLLKNSYLNSGLHLLTASKILAGDLTGAAQNIFKLSALGTGAMFRLKYYLVFDQGDFTATRKEVEGVKSWTAIITGAGAWGIQQAVAQEIAERIQNAAPAVLAVTLVNGDATGGFIAVNATNYNNAGGKHVFVLEVMPMTPNAQLAAT